MSAHTPGPWRLSLYFPNRVCGERYDSEGKFIADCDCNGADERNEQDAANARLIAAAPDLLDFAQWVISDRFDSRDLYSEARAAIAKATGGAA